MAEWIGVIHDTAPKYLQGAADLTIRERLFFAFMKRHGRFRFNETSYQCTWDVEFAEPPAETYGDGGQLTFDRHDLLRQLTIDWRGYVATDMMTKKEELMNAGDVAIVKRYDRIMPTLMKTLTNKFNAELFINGSLNANSQRLHGMETFMASGTTVAADRVAKPAGTYGGLSTALGSEGGTWSSNSTTKPNASVGTDWPNGQGDAEYDFLAPKLINTSSTSWGTGSTNWSDNCEQILRQSTIWLTRGSGKSGTPTMHLLSSEMYYDWLNYQSAKQKIIVPHKEAEDLGFTGTLQQDGVAVHHDFDVPSNTGYAVNIHQMELVSIDKILFAHEGPTYDAKARAWLFVVGFFGNARFNPKYFGKYYPYA